MRVRITISCVVLYLSSFTSCFAQGFDTTMFINNLTKYRELIIDKPVDNISVFENTLTQISNIHDQEHFQKSVLRRILFQGLVGGKQPKAIKEALVHKSGWKREAFLNLPNEGILQIVENPDLTAFIIEEYLSYKFPYPIINQEAVIEELSFYDIRRDDKIAEIGAGSGSFAILLYLLDLRNIIYINELQASLLDLINLLIKVPNSMSLSSSFVKIHGDKKSINLPEKVDKIICRMSYHHFDKRKKMLKSCRQSLKSNGHLFLYEKSMSKKSRGDCDELLEYDDLKTFPTKHGFKLVSELHLEGYILLKFELK